jgi:methyl-accepting chemotaxis protein
VTFPKLSIATKLYAIFALMATITVALSAVAVSNAHHHAAQTADFEAYNAGSWNLERLNSLLNASTREMLTIATASNSYAAAGDEHELNQINEQMGAVLADWQISIRDQDASDFSRISVQIATFRNRLSDFAQTVSERGPPAARPWMEQNKPLQARDALGEEIGKLSRHYTDLSRRAYTLLGNEIDRTALALSALAGFAILLALVGAYVIMRNVARPLAAITRITVAVADGNGSVEVPFSERGDEIGALARSIGVFKGAMQDVKELSGTIADDADAQKRNRARMSDEIARFSAEVEATLSELGRIADQMLAASSALAHTADDASAKTARAEAASAEASSNVHDIASAADELSASVNEIDRQVAQSNAIATKAVNEAEATNVAVKELGDAAARIGDVIKLITDIAEQTNLLALNATIEAARAGEAGRGFAVVAGEVKALAGQTSRATEEIGAQIAGMQRATLRSIQAISAIEHTIREIGNISGAIAAAVTEQGAATQEIARSVEIAARRTEETAGVVNVVGTATQDTRASASAVKAVADDLGDVAGRIRAQVDVFFDRLSA